MEMPERPDPVDGNVPEIHPEIEDKKGDQEGDERRKLDRVEEADGTALGPAYPSGDEPTGRQSADQSADDGEGDVGDRVPEAVRPPLEVGKDPLQGEDDHQDGDKYN